MKLLSRIGFRVAVAITTMAVATGANAQWTVTRLHPPGATYSGAYGLGTGQICGVALTGGTYRAALWSAADGAYTDLNPSGALLSVAYSTRAGRQVGISYFNVDIGYDFGASLWLGTAAAHTNLTPGAIAFGTDGTQHVGYAYLAIDLPVHASLWTGTSTSWVDLNPAGHTESHAYGVAKGQQVGVAMVYGPTRTFHPSLWRGTAASWVDLTPPGSTAGWASGTDGIHQVGVAQFASGSRHAIMWTGTAASWVDLNPVYALTSDAQAVAGGYQAGHVGVMGQSRASIWHGTADSVVDLHTFLPLEFALGSSYAWGMEVRGGKAIVVGEAYNTVAGQSEAVMWTMPVPDTIPPDISSLNPSTACLWPPNHQMETISLSGTATDDSGGPVTFQIVSVTSSEPDNGLGDGDTANDWVITGPMTVDLRAERSGTGPGRTYTITVRCTDASGNVSYARTTVCVPHDQSGKK
jgi:hypothetical protein